MIIIIQFAIVDSDKQLHRHIKESLRVISFQRNIRIEPADYYTCQSLLDNLQTLPDIMVINPVLPDIDGIEAAKQVKLRSERCVIALMAEDTSRVLDGYTVPVYRFYVKCEAYIILTTCVNKLVSKAFETHEILHFNFLGGNKHIRVHQMEYLESRANLTAFVFCDGTTLLLKEKLDNLQSVFGPFGFVRAHKSYLVNLRHIHALKSRTVYMNSGTAIVVPKGRFHYVQQKLNAYIP